MAYGVTSKRVDDTRHNIVLTALPKQEVFMKLFPVAAAAADADAPSKTGNDQNTERDDDDAAAAALRPRAITTIAGSDAYLESVFVASKERRFNPIPKVLYVEIHGTSLQDGAAVMERIDP